MIETAIFSQTKHLFRVKLSKITRKVVRLAGAVIKAIPVYCAGYSWLY